MELISMIFNILRFIVGAYLFVSFFLGKDDKTTTLWCGIAYLMLID